MNEAAYPNAVLHDNPLAFYRLDDAGSTLKDFGTNGLNGSYGSTVTHGAGSLVPNTIDPAAGFPGGAWSANGIATVAHTTTLQPANLSIELWISETAANSSGYVDLVSYGPQSSGQAYSLQLSPSNTVSAYVVTANSPGYSQLVGNTVLTPGTVYHLVMTYDGTSPKIYINGVAETGTSYGAATGGNIGYSGVGTTYGLSIGGGQSTTRNLFNGTIDDVSIYSAALTSSQVSTHDAAGQAAPDDAYAASVMSDTPVSYYRLDDTGTTMYDATNDRLNGTYGSGVTKSVTGIVAVSPDKAASFPGGAWSANSIATVPQNSLLQPANLSIEAWIYESTANSTGYVDLVSYGPQNSGQAYSLQLSPSNTISAYVVTANSPGYSQLVGSTVLATGRAYHVVMTYDGTSPKISINGTAETGTSYGATTGGNVGYSGVGTTYGLSIGGGQSTTRNVFNGTIDEVAVYGKALSSTRVSAHYTASTATAAGTGPSHIQTWAYYDNSHNSGASISFLLRYVDWVEESAPYGNFGGTYLPLMNAYKAAGGAHAVWYGDPNISYHCNAPFGPTTQNTPGTCAPAISGYNHDADWLHGATTTNYGDGGGYTPNYAGARLHTEYPSGSDSTYGEKLNPGNSEVQSAYATYTNNQVGMSPIDAVLMDDASPYYLVDDLTYHFGTTSTEYGSTSGSSAYTSDMLALACASKRPVFFNGASYDPNNATGTATADSTMYKSSCVRGAMIEGAFSNGGYRKSLNYGASWNTFLASADQALLAQSYGKDALLLNEASVTYGNTGYDPLGDRLYALGGIWLVYDPRYTIAWSFIQSPDDPNMVDAGGNSDSLVPEFQIVPTQPLATATGHDITTLQHANGHTATGGPAGGPFVREFTTCYQNGTSIGHCAVVLNAEDGSYTSGGVESMPSLTYSYSSSLVLTDAPADNGGTARFTGSVPTTLQPKTAVILKQ